MRAVFFCGLEILTLLKLFAITIFIILTLVVEWLDSVTRGEAVLLIITPMVMQRAELMVDKLYIRVVIVGL